MMKLVLTLMAMSMATANSAQATGAKNHENREIKLFSKAKISLTDAIKTAETRSGGKAMEAELDEDSKNVRFKVEVIKEGKVQNIVVDGISGQILKVSKERTKKKITEIDKD